MEWVREFCRAHAFQINVNKTRYIISNYKGHNDPRWLFSVNGEEKIAPLPSSTHFRYLGLWISMDLDWSKQVQVLNKEVMDWRWKAFAAEVDPAHLRSWVVEYLLPRMEIGLVHANVTKKMCDAWTSTIITTICHRGGMSTVATLNKKAFLVLAEIPDIWMRTQTTRACELLVSLNTNYCEVGRSTIARLCGLAKVPARNSKLAVEELTSLRSLNTRKFCRLASTIQYRWLYRPKTPFRQLRSWYCDN